MSTVHLICGGTGAGKTTYAEALARRVRGMRLSLDEWMARLFAADLHHAPAPGWARERAARCESLMWRLGDQLLATGIDVIFDVGLARRDDRDRFRYEAAVRGAACKLHYLDVDVETRRARVRDRQAARGGATPFETNEASFDSMEAAFEAPSDDELYEAMIVCS